jgi:hypothetical protein
MAVKTRKRVRSGGRESVRNSGKKHKSKIGKLVKSAHKKVKNPFGKKHKKGSSDKRKRVPKSRISKKSINWATYDGDNTEKKAEKKTDRKPERKTERKTKKDGGLIDIKKEKAKKEKAKRTIKKDVKKDTKKSSAKDVVKKYEIDMKKSKYTRSELKPIIDALQRACGDKLTPVGGWRRNKPLMKDIDFMTEIDLEKLSMLLLKDKRVYKLSVTHNSKNERKKISFKYYHKVGDREIKPSIDIFKVSKDEYPFALLQYTGNKLFNIHMRAYAKKKGYKLNQYGLFKVNGDKLDRVPGIKVERDIFDKLGYTYKEPADRNPGEHFTDKQLSMAKK